MPVSQPIWSLREEARGEQLLGSLQRELPVSFIPFGDMAHKTQTQLGTVQSVLPAAQGAAVGFVRGRKLKLPWYRSPFYGFLCTCSVLIIGRFKTNI